MNIANTLKQAVAAGDVPGVAAAAATDKGIVFEGAAGSLDFDSVIWIASMTKAVTGAAAMQLVERGKLALDGPAADIVPELGKKGVLVGFDRSGRAETRAPRRPITLRHLLTHTSGLGYDTWNADIMQYRQATGIPAVGSCQNVALTTPLLADPGDRWEYGISIDWAGKMVEAVSGLRLDRYLKENIFEPLGMSDTGFKIGPAQRPRKGCMHADRTAARPRSSTSCRRTRSSTWAVADSIRPSATT
jgi:methyl acetate hydrolase